MKKLTLLSFLLASILLFSSISFAFAQSQEEMNAGNILLDVCTCFCKSADGAQNLEERADESLCRDACKAGDFYYLGCYGDEENFPINNSLCWTRADCESADSVSTDEEGSDWGGQESQCLPGMGYCYNRVKPIQLGQAIDGVSEVGSFSQYISLIYAYLIPAASLLAIVLLMVGGLEYMLAAGKPAGIEKAKNRIKNALIGLVILLGAYSIAYLIDPNLVSFNELRIPRVRTVTYLDQDSSCEAIEQKGGIVQPISTTQECGFEGRIISLEAISKNSKVVGIEEGGTCVYHSCEDQYAVCTGTPTAETKFSCLRCYNAAEVIEDVTASDCRRLVHVPLDIEKQQSHIAGKDEKFYCEYEIMFKDECVEIVYPTFYFAEASPSLNCAILRQDARGQGSESCRAYDIVGVRDSGTLITDGVVMLGNFLTKNSELSLTMTTNLHTKICTEDPCDLAPPGGSCGVYATTGHVDCVDSTFLQQAELSSMPKLILMNTVDITDVNGDKADFNPSW